MREALLIGWVSIIVLLLSGCNSEKVQKKSESQIKTTLHGIDVSHYQGQVDWQKVAQSGMSFTFIKATQGIDSVDGRYADNWHKSKQTSLRRGVYHYFDPSLDAKKQAEHFLATTGADFGELPPVVDIESFEKQTNKEVINSLMVFLTLVESKTQCKPLIYTGPGFWDALDDHDFGSYPLWLADYSQQAKLPSGWRSWQFWQYESNSRVDGVNGDVDMNRFASNLAKLESLQCIAS